MISFKEFYLTEISTMAVQQTKVIRSVNGSKIEILPIRMKHIIDRHGTTSMHAKAIIGENPTWSGLSGSIFHENPDIQTFVNLIEGVLDTTRRPISVDTNSRGEEFYTWNIPCQRCGYFLADTNVGIGKKYGDDQVHVGYTSIWGTQMSVYMVDRPLLDFIAEEMQLVFKKIRNFDVYKLWTAYPSNTNWTGTIWSKNNGMIVPIG